MTVKEIAEEHGVSRVSIHTYRRRGAFPQPVEGEGTTRLRFRGDEVAAFFAANPPTPGKRTDLASRQQQGEPVVIKEQAAAQPLSDDARTVLEIVWKWIADANDGRGSDVGDLQHELETAGYGPLPEAQDG